MLLLQDYGVISLFEQLHMVHSNWLEGGQSSRLQVSVAEANKRVCLKLAIGQFRVRNQFVPAVLYIAQFVVDQS